MSRPPPNKSILKRIIKAGGQPLHGMVPSSSSSEDDESTEQDDNEDFLEFWLSGQSLKELEHPNAEEDDAK
ncbi:hypothetical protein KOW79_010275 [Hemibagrus wyckioides]|uniref:Uncharacterized protein n=1 Tax=Hemibagrus wyckioides TaxID=337641 RepID=A0A9D3NQW0_9TELE|nr:hypothetical protein KOW79_010275 [Hemibagrus wyckioides]